MAFHVKKEDQLYDHPHQQSAITHHHDFVHDHDGSSSTTRTKEAIYVCTFARLATAAQMRIMELATTVLTHLPHRDTHRPQATASSPAHTRPGQSGEPPTSSPTATTATTEQPTKSDITSTTNTSDDLTSACAAGSRRQETRRPPGGESRGLRQARRHSSEEAPEQIPERHTDPGQTKRRAGQCLHDPPSRH